ncbi:MAG: formate--tetrahydrofolate ligase [Candidatus Bathyarchaeota archaeon]|jgi:formate--tetrahydrofolate ligase|nr:formate--tetrahydrofolate ligase [Candidatus Bathyarchaeota archaeon]
MKTDIEIAQEAKMRPIMDVAEDLGISEDEVELYGKHIGKISLGVYERLKEKMDGKLIVVTAITPTSLGEGKTTMSIGLGEALSKLGKNAIVCLRQPSLGPVFGIKGGAAGGGYAQVMPMVDINTGFTGDFDQVERAHNLLIALLENHLYRGNRLSIDVNQITWKYVMDMNERSLRNIVVGLGGKEGGVPRESGFDITTASEIMAIHALSTSLMDLKERVGRIVIAYTTEGKAVRASDLNAQGAMALLLRKAIKPNLIQTLEGSPTIMHGGPFANIAHGCPSLIGIKLARKLGEYVVAEPGFGADLGAEKFFHIACHYGGLKPDVAVLVVTIRALKRHGGIRFRQLEIVNVKAVEKGLVNMEKHIENLKKFGVPVVVCINVFPKDSQAEIDMVTSRCRDLNVPASETYVVVKGGEGGLDLARKVVETIEREDSKFHPLYDVNQPIRDKIDLVSREIYGASGVEYSSEALNSIKQIEALDLHKVPLCVAKTQYSFSDVARLKGRPTGFKIHVRDVKISNGAGFLVVLAGDIMTMPGLGSRPAAEQMDIDEKGRITGLF